MYISQISIKNIKGFHNLELDFRRTDGGPSGWTVLAGRNGSGKTTLLRALALGVAGPQGALRLMQDFKGWVRESAEEAMVRVEVEASDDYDVWHTPARPGGGLTKQKRERTHVVASLRWTQTPRSDVEPVLQTQGEAENGDATRTIWRDSSGWFICGYGATRRVQRGSEMAQIYDVESRIGCLISLFRDDTSLEGAVGRLKQIYLRSLDTNLGERRQVQASELLRYICNLLNDGLLQEGDEVLRVDSRGLWIKQAGVELLLEDLSDGYRVVCALVIDLVVRLSRDGLLFKSSATEYVRDHTELAGVVLIDEADLHLHISWQQRLGFWLKAKFPRVQFIVTSHSPFICQAADQIILLPAAGSKEPARPMPPEVFHQIVNGGVEDAVLSELFGLASSRSRQAESLLRELAVLERKVRKQTATEQEVRRYHELDAQMPASADVERALLRLGAGR